MNSKELNLVMLIGIPASGKSTVANKFREQGYVVLSSDEKRERLYGEGFPESEVQREKLKTAIYSEIRKEAKANLLSGRSVVIDATNLNRKKRMKMLSFFEHIRCRKTAILMVVSHELCEKRNELRPIGKRVPRNDMLKLIKGFEIPTLGEGWDEIEAVIDGEKYDFPFELLSDFAQDNPHHTLTLGGHMDAAKEYALAHGYSERLIKLCALHDIGKLYTKQFANYKGEPTDTAHYYGHENFGAYLYLTMELCGRNRSDEEIKEILREAAIINCHMRPLVAWRDSLTAKEHDKEIFGEEFVSDIEKINAADRAAH